MDPIFKFEWRPSGDELVATVDLPNGAVEIRVGSKTEMIQPAPGLAMVGVTRWAFAILRDGYRLSSGQGAGVDQTGIFRAAYKAVLRVAAMESVVGVCPACGEHTYPQQQPDKNGAANRGRDDRIVCSQCSNDPGKRLSCRGCYTLGYLYRPGVENDLRCIDKACASRRQGVTS